jgi:HEAT repeat protein
MSRLPVLVAVCAVIVVGACAAAQAGEEAAPEPALPASVPELIEWMGRDDFAGMAASRRLVEIGQPALPALLQATRHNVPRVRYWSIASLSAIRDERAVPALLERLKDSDPIVRAVAVWHLGRWFDREEVRNSILEKLDDEDPFVVGWTLNLLRAKRCLPAAARVRKLMQATRPEVRHDALHTLAVLEGADALELMKRTLREDESVLVRECAVRACTVIEPPDPRTAEVLILALRDRDQPVREAAVRLLRKGFGQHFGFEADADAPAREAAVKKWQEWYDARRDELHWNAEFRRFRATGREERPDR